MFLFYCFCHLVLSHRFSTKPREISLLESRSHSNPSSTVQKVKGLIYADSGLIFAVSLHYILDDFGAGGQF